MECVCSHCRYESVANEVEGFSQSHGRPISAATNLGLRSAFGDPVFPSGSVVRGWGPDASPASVLPWVVPCVGAWRVVRFSFMDAQGVGHIFAWTVNEVGCCLPPPMRSFMARCASGDF